MPNISKLLTLAAAAAALSGCASMMHGPYEKLSISSSPEKALCKIYRKGHGYIKAVATPGETYIMRDEKPITVTCSKKGYKTTSVVTETERAESQDNVGNAVNFGIGFFVDKANHMQDRLPDNIHIRLPRE